jgi:hypothetical protein
LTQDGVDVEYDDSLSMANRPAGGDHGKLRKEEMMEWKRK